MASKSQTRTVAIALGVATVITMVFSGASSAAPSRDGGRLDGPFGGEIDVDDGESGHEVAAGASFGFTPEDATTPRSYTFYPQGGRLWQDLGITNYVDLAGPGTITSFGCNAHSYDGHNGIDSIIRSFREQAIGVPVFAALDGVVTQTHDGEPDMNTTAAGQPANFVTIDHGGTHLTQYLHLKNGSVAVTPGQPVEAGTQIGLTASSGNSTFPHLHLTSLYQGAAYEPYAGPCRSGPSYWQEQVPTPTTLQLSDFQFSPTSFNGSNAPPFDQGVRTGTFVTGSPRDIYFRFDGSGLPPSQPWRIRFVRPDSGVELDVSGTLGNASVQYGIYYWWHWLVNLTQTGTWRLWFDLNNVRVIDVPFRVVSSAAENVNRAPNPVTVSLTPSPARPGNVMRCQVQTSLLTEDPDYDIMRYRYEWAVNGVTVRDVTTAGIVDALPRESMKKGDQLRCRVTPSDGTLSAATASTTVTASDPADVGVFRPSSATWLVRNGPTAGWGSSGDVPVPGDYDGNATEDMAVFRPSNGTWFVRNGTTAAWGTSGDIPVPGDYDGNGTTDIAVFRPSSGTWFVRNGPTVAWGASGDIPVPGDYDGNGTTEMAIFRPSNSTWFVRNGTTAAWGTSGDIPVPGDYDGNGTTDIAVFRPSSGTWFVRNGTTAAWGTSGDIPVPADFDGNGTTEMAVFRPSNGLWFVRGGATVAWGTGTDVPLILPHAIGRSFFSPPF